MHHPPALPIDLAEMCAGTLHAWKGLQGLQSLNLSSNPGIRGTLPADWHLTLPQLKTLELDGGPFRNSELQGTLPAGTALSA